MSLLTIAQSIAKDTKAGEVPSTIINNNNETAKQLLSAIRRATFLMSQAHDWQILIAEYNFNTSNGTSSYSLPSDIDGTRILNNTFWDSTNRRQGVGVLTPQEWQYFKRSSVAQSSINDYYRIRGGNLLIFPTPSSTRTIYYEYVKNTPVKSSGGTAQTDWAADSDLPYIDSFLIELQAKWIYLSFNGKPYAEAKLEADQYLQTKIGQDGSRRSVISADVDYLSSGRFIVSDINPITP